MVDLSTNVSSNDVTHFQYDNTRGLLYLTTESGQFEAWNPVTQTIVGAVTLGGAASSVALTPDGRYAIVGESAAVGTDTDAVDRIDLSTLTDQRLLLTVQPGTAQGIGNIAVDAAGKAVFSSPYNYFNNAGYQVQQFDAEAATLQSQVVAGPGLGVNAGQQVISAPGTNLVFLKANTMLSGNLEVLNPVTGAYVSGQYTFAGDPYAGASVPTGPVSGMDAISVAAGLFVDIAYANIHVYDFSLHQVADLTSQVSWAHGAQFSPDGRELFLRTSLTNISAYDTQTWTPLGSLTLPSSGYVGLNLNEMAISADGRFLFASYSPDYWTAGVRQIDLTAEWRPTIKADGVHTLVTGSIYNDTLVSSAASETLDGGAGNNTASYATAAGGVTVSLALEGSAQNTISAGSDTLINIQNLIGSAFADHLTGDANDNVIDGGGGDDVIDGRGGANTVSFASAAHGVTVSLALQGSAQTTGVGTDTLSNFQNLIGSAFNDTLEGDGNNNVIDAGGGTNTVSYAHATAAVTVSLALQGLAQNTVGAGSDTLSNFQHIIGSAFADHLTGDANNNTIDGGGGDDTLDGGGGTNTLSFASATTGVTVSLALQGTGTPQTTGVGNVTLYNFQNMLGSAHDDHLTGDANNNVVDGGGGNDTLDGGGGTNTVSFASATTGVTVSLALQGQAQNTGVGTDTLSNFQNVTGTAFNDTLEGDGGNNVLDGGGGINTVSYAHAAAGVTVSLSLGAQNTIGAGTDTFSHFQNLTGSGFNDTLSGDAHNNVLDGGGGINTVSYANALASVTVSLVLQGQAQITSGAGIDTLFNFQNLVGSDYNDTLTSATGTSSLTGGLGADTFRLDAGSTNVTITDFSSSQLDWADLSAFTQFSSFAAVKAAAQQVGSDTVINLGPGTLTLKGVTATALTPRDFGFPAQASLPANFPYSSVCFISDVIGGEVYWGSGVIIGPHTILTAAHMVWSQDVGLAATHLEIYLGNGGGVFPPATLVHYNAVDDANDEISPAQSQSDFAIINVSQNLSSNGWFGIDTSFMGGPGAIAGYPATTHPNQQDTTGTLTVDGEYNLVDYGPEFSISPGSSGGPVWIGQGAAGSAQPQVVGLVSTASYGARITASDLVQIQGWIAQDAHLWKVRGDLIGLGVSDLVFRNTASGDWGYVGPNGSAASAWHEVGFSSPAYAEIGAADFTGNGVSDVAFRNNATGDFGYMSLSGGLPIWHDIGWSSPAYAAIGAADFSGDGVADMAFRNNTTGDFGYMVVTSGSPVWHDLGASSPAYTAIGIGQFNQTGTLDIAFRNLSTGDWGYMVVYNGVATWIDLGVWDPTYTAVGVGAFYGGSDGVAFRNAAGDYGFMEINYATPTWHSFGIVNSAYTVVGVGDYNGDRLSDIAFHNGATGDLGYVTLVGQAPTWHSMAISNGGFLNGASYAPLAGGDLDGDGVADLAMRDPATGSWAYMSITGSGLQWQDDGWASPDYAVIGEGRFGGAASGEVAFRSSATGDWGFMTPAGSGTSVWHALGWSSPDYAAVGAGDFNGDHLTDMAFRSNATGDYGFMTVSGASTIWHGLGWSSPAYAAVGVGDFNGDGFSDIAFRNASNGDWGYMAISGGVAAWHALGWSSPAYTAIGVGDFNGDGHVDMAFRNASSGDWGYMTTLGDQTAWHGLGWSSPAYTPFTTGDFNGDHVTDMAFRSSTGDYGYLAVTASGAAGWTDLANATAYMVV